MVGKCRQSVAFDRQSGAFPARIHSPHPVFDGLPSTVGEAITAAQSAQKFSGRTGNRFNIGL